MEAIVANDAGPAADVAFRDAYMGQLEAFMVHTSCAHLFCVLHHDLFRARFDAISAESSDLLIEHMELGTTKSDAARRKVIIATLEDMQAECRVLQNYLQRHAAASAAAGATTASHQQWQQRPHSSLNISEAGVRSFRYTHPRLR